MCEKYFQEAILGKDERDSLIRSGGVHNASKLYMANEQVTQRNTHTFTE